MHEPWVVFGGWAVKPDILAPLFGPDAVLIDSNSLIPGIMAGAAPAPDWRRLLIDSVSAKMPQGAFRMAGWSTGAILAAAIAEFVRPSCGVFISATPSFCRRQGFAYGWKSAVLQAMREELKTDRDWVLDKFYLQCGIDDQFRAAGDADLPYGLCFLEHASLLPLSPFPFPSLFLHGSADTIVLPDAGKYFCREAGGVFKEFNGPHAFFAMQYNTIKETIHDFAYKI
jgi:alpha/beta superfamily hydrolase